MDYKFYTEPVQVTKTFLPEYSEYTAILRTALEKNWITNHGDLEQQLTTKLRDYLDVPHINLCANGTLALQLALRASQVQGGEVITMPFTYIATASSIVWEGAQPVFADIQPDTLVPSLESIAACITPQTKAILLVHVFGLPAVVEGLQELADSHGIPLLYDAAHAFGVIYKNRSLTAYGNMSTCSFHATKFFHTVEGGAVVCHDAELSRRIEKIGSFGHIHNDCYECLGINAKMSEFHAAMGLAVLPHLEEIRSARQKLTRFYDRCLPFGAITKPVLSPDIQQYNYSYYPVIMESEEQLLKLRELLAQKNIFIRRYFYPSLDTVPYLQARAACPVSQDISRRICCLPLSHDTPLSVAQDVAESMRQIMLEGAPFVHTGKAEPPKVSVLTITYNQENYIEDCIKSVAMQECDFPIEHVIGEDASSDRTREIVLDYAATYKHIRPLIQPRRTYGLGNVRAVFSNIYSPYVAPCEGDDYFIDRHKLQKQADALDAHPDVAVCAHPVEVFFQKTGKKEVYPDRGIKSFFFMRHRSIFTLPELLRKNFIQTNSAMYRWRFPGELPVWFNNQCMPQDWYWHLMHAETGKILFLWEIMSGYRRHDDGLWASSYVDRAQHLKNWAYPMLRQLQVLHRHFHGQYWWILRPQMVEIFKVLVDSFPSDSEELDFYRTAFPEAAAACDAEYRKSSVRRRLELLARKGWPLMYAQYAKLRYRAKQAGSRC